MIIPDLHKQLEPYIDNDFGDDTRPILIDETIDRGAEFLLLLPDNTPIPIKIDADESGFVRFIWGVDNDFYYTLSISHGGRYQYFMKEGEENLFVGNGEVKDIIVDNVINNINRILYGRK